MQVCIGDFVVSWIGGFVRGNFFKYFDGLVSINDLLREKEVKFFMLNGATKYDVRNKKFCRSDALTCRRSEQYI